MARLVSVNVGTPQDHRHGDRVVNTAIVKRPVSGRVPVRGVNLAGDDQADRRVHGGTDKAVYAYGAEDLSWWEEQIGREIEPGTFGENLTVSGLDLREAEVGDRWSVGSVELEVSEPRIPCFKFAMVMGDPGWPGTFTKVGRPGTYLRIVGEGDLGAGDEIIVEPSGSGLTIGEFVATYNRGTDVERLLTTPGVSDGWREWAERQQARGR